MASLDGGRGRNNARGTKAKCGDFLGQLVEMGKLARYLISALERSCKRWEVVASGSECAPPHGELMRSTSSIAGHPIAWAGVVFSFVQSSL